MASVKVYDWDFSRLSNEIPVQSSNWTLYYNDIGTWEGHFDLTSEIIPLMLNNPYIVVTQGRLQAVIPGKQAATDGVLYGRTCNWMLTGGVLPDFDPQHGDVETLVRSYVRQSLPYMQLGETVGFTKQIDFWRNTYNYTSDVVKDCLNNDGGGHRVVYDPTRKQWVFECLNGQELPFIISDKMLNAYDSEYTEDMLDYYSGGWYQEDQPDDADGNPQEPTWKYITKDDKSGQYKRDAILSATTEAEARAELAKAAMNKKVQVKTKNLVYGKDYELGDIARVQFEAGGWRTTQRKRITGVNIWYEANDQGEQPILEDLEG